MVSASRCDQSLLAWPALARPAVGAAGRDFFDVRTSLSPGPGRAEFFQGWGGREPILLGLSGSHHPT